MTEKSEFIDCKFIMTEKEALDKIEAALDEHVATQDNACDEGCFCREAMEIILKYKGMQ